MPTRQTAAMMRPDAFPQPWPFLDAAPSAAFCPDHPAAQDPFALELRAESIEQLCGGDALRRGESERIEAGGSDGNADLVTGCDRVQVQDTLSEHTGHGLALQAAHLHATVGGSFDTRAGQEDTVLLAGHMRDTWNGGTVTVAAMTDDTAGGGGVRTNALDLWVHGLMGLEERPGTCTADAVLAEVCGTLYEREYRSAVHAAGLAVFNGALYQSVRNSFRPLMRISMGVRNLIAGGGGGAAGETPPVSPPPAAGEAGAEAASATLAAGEGVAETPQAGIGAAHLDDAVVLTRKADIPAVCADVTELNRSADTAERLGGLRVALRRAEAGGEAAGGVRASRVEDAASGRPAGDAPGMLGGRPAAVALDPVAPAPRAGDPRTPGTRVKLGLLGGADDPVRSKWDHLQWISVYWQSIFIEVAEQYRSYMEEFNWPAARELKRGIEAIDARVADTYRRFSGHIGDLADRPHYVTETEAAYRSLATLARQAEQAGDPDSAAAIRRSLEGINEFTYRLAVDVVARSNEFADSRALELRHSRLDSRIHVQRFSDWIEEQIRHAMTTWGEARSGGDIDTRVATFDDMPHLLRVRDNLHEGIDPRIDTRNRVRALTELGLTEEASDMARLHDHLVEIMANPEMLRPATPTATPSPSRAPSPGSTGGLVDLAGAPGPAPQPSLSVPAHLVSVVDGGGFRRAMLDHLGFGPGDGIRADSATGGAVSHPSNTEAVVNPRLDVESAFWLSPARPEYSMSSAGFDAGLRRASEPPDVSPRGPGEAMVGGSETDHARGVLGATPGMPGFDDVDTPRFGAAGEAFRRRHADSPTFTIDPAVFDSLSPSWAEDDFAIERTLIDGRLPSRFDASELIAEWGWLAANTPLEGLLESHQLPTRTIDSMIESYRAEGQGNHSALLIQYLESMKESIARALAATYRYRADPDWIATVDELLRADIAEQAARRASVADSRQLTESTEALRVNDHSPPSRAPPDSLDATGPTANDHSPPSPVPPDSLDATGPTANDHSPPSPVPPDSLDATSPTANDHSPPSPVPPDSLDATGPTANDHSPPSPVPPDSLDATGPTAVDAGLRPPTDDDWRRRSPGMHDSRQTARFGDHPTLSADNGTHFAIPNGVPQGWQAVETPGFGRAASNSGEVPLSRREQILDQLMVDEASPKEQVTELTRFFEETITAEAVGGAAPKWQSAFVRDLNRLVSASRTSPDAVAGLDDVDWHTLDQLATILEPPTFGV